MKKVAKFLPAIISVILIAVICIVLSVGLTSCGGNTPKESSVPKYAASDTTEVAVYELTENEETKELEANLSYLLGLKEYGAENKTFFGKILDKLRGNSDSGSDTLLSQEEVENASKAKTAANPEPIVAATQVEVAGEAAVPISIRARIWNTICNNRNT